MNPIQSMIVAVLCSSTGTALVVKLVEFIVKQIEKKKNKGPAKMAADLSEIKEAISDISGEIKELKESDIVILHDKIYRLFEALWPEADISAEDEANLDYIFDRYKKLGGNHKAEIMYNRIKAKPVRN